MEMDMDEYILPERPSLDEAKTRPLTLLELQALVVDFIEYENKRWDNITAHVNRMAGYVNEHDRKLKNI